MMMTASTKGLVVAVVALAAAAVAGATKASGSRGVGSFTITNNTNNINSKSDDENKYLDEVVFSHDMLNEYRLYMKESDLNWLNTHELIEQYVPGKFRTDGLSFRFLSFPNTLRSVPFRLQGM